MFIQLLYIALFVEQHRFELHCSTYMCNFSINTVRSLYLLVSHPWIQLTTDCKQCFWSVVGNLQRYRANSVHCSMPFYIWDLTIHQFWHPQGILVSIPCRYWEPTVVKFWGLKIYVHIFLLHGRLSPNPHIVQVSTVLLS